jgi:hypothetical protein
MDGLVIHAVNAVDGMHKALRPLRKIEAQAQRHMRSAATAEESELSPARKVKAPTPHA